MIDPNDLIIKTFVSRKEKTYAHHKAKEYGVEIFHIPTTTTISVDFYENAFKNKNYAIRFLEQLLESNERHIYS